MSDRLAFGIAADLLAQGAVIERLSLLLSLAGVVYAVLGAWPIGLAVLALGLAQGWIALRVGFDARLFARLAQAPDLDAFDAAMTSQGLMPAAKAGRPAALRIAGARRLMAMQVALLGTQVVVLAVGVVG
ncbi:hypothetical protein [Zavarzinia sp. CC-PAN008]|uniref:hypothetical protein n=1 Tax=Zavarzinia sp. CC-PAN008 TaxID=3243332 RepID=UPI003F742357